MAMDIYKKMTPKEKYINYIVDDLISKTEIDYLGDWVKFNFYDPQSHFIYQSLPLPNIISGAFRIHLIDKYGARENDIKIVWNRYKQKITRIIYHV
jgi:hypothetical protein